MKRASVARLIWMVSAALPAVVAAAPGEASACGSAVFLSRGGDIDLGKADRYLEPVSRPRPVKIVPPSPAAKPAEIIPPFSTPKHIEIVPPLPPPKAKPRVPPPPQIDRPLLVADAEEALSQGKHLRAATLVAAAYPALKRIAPGTFTMADRALRVLALASVRRDGRLDAGGLTGKTAADRAANLVWSVEVLGSLSARRANNPAYQTDLGEALASVPARRADAARILDDLAARDLVTTGEGYAALVRLRAEQGDDAGRSTLIERCALMTRTPAICAVPAATGGPGRT